ESSPVKKRSCPQIASIFKETKKRYLVRLSSRDIQESHYQMLQNCFNKVIETNSDDYQSIQSNLNINIKDRIHKYNVGNIFGYIGYLLPSVAKEIAKSSDIHTIMEDIPFKVIADSCSYNTQKTDDTLQNLDRIDQFNYPLDGNYNYPNSAGQDVNCYVLDSQFNGRAKIGGVFCGDCTVINDDDVGHGTHVAGIIGGATFGVAKKVNLISVRVVDNNGQGTIGDVVKGLEYVVGQHNQSSNKNTIINMSLSYPQFGNPFFQTLNDYVDEVVAQNIHVVVAAGNTDQNAQFNNTFDDACLTSPGAAKSVITVGTEVLSAGIDSSNGVATHSGTSMATPHGL
ncbi:6736_t:CDS:2, partial [Racocetra persica]